MLYPEQQRKRERCSLARLGLNPNLAAVALDNPFAYRKTGPGSIVLVARVEPIEHSKDAGSLVGIDADPLVADVSFRS